MTPHDYGVKIVKDSVNPVGNRLTTFELTYPRFVHAELMTHRLFSRNSASSRAIPTPVMCERIERSPVLPKWWGKNQSGMQAAEELSPDEIARAKEIWLAARDHALLAAGKLRALGLHKQIANRILEPWMFITVIVSATEFGNWFWLRDNWPEGQPPGPAQPEIAWVAREMHKLYKANEPTALRGGQWHLPYVETVDRDHDLYVGLEELADTLKTIEYVEIQEAWCKISTARCARVSYLTHDGVRDLPQDLGLHDRLATSGHWSPFEHVAAACHHGERSGNFFGWRQYRKSFETEHHGKRMD